MESITEIFLNIICNFIPNKRIRIRPSDPSWITNPIKAVLCKQDRQYKNYKIHGFRLNDKVSFDTFPKVCEQAISAKVNYLNKLDRN